MINESPINDISNLPDGHYLKYTEFEPKPSTMNDNIVIKEIRDVLGNIKWQDIIFEDIDITYIVKFNDNVIAKLKTIYDKYTDEFEDVVKNELSNQGAFADIIEMCTTNYDILDDYCMIVVDKDENNRVHFSNGIVKSLRGLGLGKKIYRGIIEKTKYISSGNDTTQSIQYLWSGLIYQQLIPDTTIYVFTDSDTTIFGISSTIPDRFKVYYELVIEFLDIDEDEFDDYLEVYNTIEKRKKKNIFIDEHLLEECVNYPNNEYAELLLDLFVYTNTK